MEEIAVEILVIEAIILIIGLVGNIFVLLIACEVKKRRVFTEFL